MAHPVTDALASVTDPTQRQANKVAAFVALPNVVNKVTVGAYVVTLVTRPVAAKNGTLQFNVKITKSGAEVALPPDFNPVEVTFGGWLPHVPDPAGDIVKTFTDRDGNVTTQTFREDLHAALMVIAGNLVSQLEPRRDPLLDGPK